MSDNNYLILTPYFPSKNSFMGNYIFDQAKAIQNNSKYNISIIKIVSLFSSETDYNYCGFSVKIFKIIDFPLFIFPGFFNFFNKLRFNFFLKKSEIYKDLKVVHSHVTYPAAYLANSISSFINIKTISHHHGLDVLQLKNGRFSWIRHINRNYLIKSSIKQLNQISLNVGVSALVLEQLHKFPEYQPKKETVLYNGVDHNLFYPKKNKIKDKFIIGCVGNFWVTKNQITLLKAVSILIKKNKAENILVKFIGEGSELSECKKFCTENNLDFVDFIDYQKHNLLNEFYNSIDLFILPSYYEAFGCVFVESAATKTPFIAVKGQGIEEIMNDKAHKHCLVKKESPKELSDKILFFYKNKSFFYPFKYDLDINNLIRYFIKNNFLDD